MSYKKRLAAIGMQAAIFAMMSDPELHTQELPESKPSPVPKAKKIPFHEQEGISKTIDEYNRIAKGNSKKGVVKQNRIKDKIKKWLDSGQLTQEHLTKKYL